MAETSTTTIINHHSHENHIPNNNTPKTTNFRFPIADFDKLFSSQANLLEFNLPDDILTDDIIASRSTRAFTRSQKLGARPRTYHNGLDSTDEEDVNNQRFKSFAARQKINSSSSRVHEKLTVYHNGRPYPRRTVPSRLDDKLVAGFPECPPITEKWDAKSFINTPFTKTVYPSKVMKGPFKLNARDIEQKFMQNCFTSHVSAIITAAKYLDESGNTAQETEAS
ncbi:12293_t:CDS:1 [Ambispora gerdemannii]|uniref:12293_t:CDS:1 n=1 Tax=Ambispora gerdemannii TaxID=144530 RepID=A0A9N8ZCH7_9GLOM|nr:12293_t:CDS:1 [Ambispora gerdemannii]